jgi:Ankyrin repeats (many copies)
MCSRNAAARLSEARLVAARGYGFASSRKMKSYIDALNDVGVRLSSAVRDGDLKNDADVLDRSPELVSANMHIGQAPPIPADSTGAEAKAHEINTFYLIHLAMVAGKVSALRLLIGRLWDIGPEGARILPEHGTIVDRAPYDARAWGPAAMVASKDVAGVLLEYGADANWQDEGGNTPIHCAIRSRIVADPADFVGILVESGADLSRQNSDGRTALDVALVQVGKKCRDLFSQFVRLCRKGSGKP